MIAINKYSVLVWILALFLTISVLTQTTVKATEVVTTTGEVLALIDSLEEAEYVASQYGITLLSYAQGVAVFTEPVMVASTYSLTSSDLPTLYENYVIPSSALSMDDIVVVDDTAAPYASSDESIPSIGYQMDTIDLDLVETAPTGRGITVAIIDTGVDTDHSALTAVVNASKAYNSHTDTYGLAAVEDELGHGTHVAGIIAAQTNTSNSMVGIAPDVELVIIRGDRSYDNAFEMASLLRAINYAVSQDVDIINMSLGSAFDAGSYDPLETVLKSAETAGILVVAAAGNDSDDNAGYPAAYSSTVAVTATNAEDIFDDSYSNYGSQITIAAPGYYIASTYLNDNYVYMSGTSMATPVVTAVAALVIQEYPEYSLAEIKALLYDSAKDAGDFGWDQYYGNGIVNVYAALEGLDKLHTVTYMNGETTKLGEHTVANGATDYAPTQPTGNVEFGGWATQATSDSYFDFDTAITGDITLYAQWLKGSQDAPAEAPTVATAYYNGSITLTTVEGAEYGVNTSNTAPDSWQTSPTFIELDDNTTYYFFLRMAETDTLAASASSPSRVVDTTHETLTFTETVTIATAPTYGDPWSGIVTYNATGDHDGTYTIVIDGTVPETDAWADTGSHEYEVLYTGTVDNVLYTNVVVTSGTVTVGARTVGITWDSTDLAYSTRERVPTATVNNLVQDTDDVTLVVSGGQTNVGTGYTATVTAITGASAEKYALPETTELTTTFSIVQSTGYLAPDSTFLQATYEDVIEFGVLAIPTAYFDASVSSVSSTETGDNTLTFLVGEEVLGSVQNPEDMDDYAYFYYDTTLQQLPIGTSYVTVQYSGNTEMAAVTVEDLFQVELSAKEITSSMVSSISSQTYTGSAITPTVTVSGLVLGTDYTVTYSNNTAVGTATVTVEGTGYYTGTVTMNFTIASATTSSDAVSGGSGGSGGGVSTTVTEPEVEIDEEIEDVTSDVTVETQDDTTTAVVSPEITQDGTSVSTALDENLLENALDALEGETDASLQMLVIADEDTASVDITLSTDVLESIAQSDLANITLSTSVGTVTIPLDTVQALVELSDGVDITVQIQHVEEDSVTQLLGEAVVVDVTILANGDPISTFNGGTLTLAIPFPLDDDQDPGGIVVWYVDDEGGLTLMNATYNSDTQCAIFDTTHCSYYAVTYATISSVYNQFIDVSASDYFYDAVLWATDKNITAGVSETEFDPNQYCTRGQIATFLYRAAGEPEVTGENPFTDVSTSDYFYDAVLWAADQNITAGVSETEFDPNQYCTRAQIVTFLYRAAGEPEVTGENPFTDVSTSDYFYNAVLWAADQNITAGVSETEFDPNQYCTRSQAVTLLYRALGE